MMLSSKLDTAWHLWSGSGSVLTSKILLCWTDYLEILTPNHVNYFLVFDSNI